MFFDNPQKSNELVEFVKISRNCPEQLILKDGGVCFVMITLENLRDTKVKGVGIFTAAIMCGVAWRIRGSGAFGSFWGMLVVGAIFAFLIGFMFGNSPKITPAYLGLLALLMAATVGGWGTIVGQVTGRLYSTGGNGVAPYDIVINPLSGWFWIFIIGFGWVPLFAVMVSWLISEKQYGLKQLIFIIIIFFGGKILSEILISPIFVPLISPEATNLFENSLMSSGQTPWTAYLNHYGDADYFESLAGGRNYVAMVDNLASAFGVIILSLWLRIKEKDTKAANATLIICLIFGLGMAVADIWQFWGRGGLWSPTNGYSLIPPSWVEEANWALWEFSTGFLSGLGLFIFLIKQAKNIKQSNENNHSIVPLKAEKPIAIFIFYIFVCGIALLRPLASQLGDTFPETEIALITYIVGGLFLIITAILYNKQKLSLPNWDKATYCWYLLVFYMPVYTIIQQLIQPNAIEITRTVPDWLVLIGGLGSIILLLALKTMTRNTQNQSLT